MTCTSTEADPFYITQRNALTAESIWIAKGTGNVPGELVAAATDGYVVNPQLREGTVVKALDRVMTFVGYGNQIVVARVPQYGANPIAIGDPVELTFKLYPGRIFKGEVEEIAWATGESQPVLSGQIPRQDELTPAQTYVVRIRPIDVPEDYPLRFGSAGTAAVYTKNATAFHIIRKVMLRIEAWTNFLGL